LLAAAGLVTLALCGCGGHAHANGTNVERGSAVFAGACASCHTLTGHDTRAPGGDLAIAKLSASAIATFIRVMPVHLTRTDAHAVAEYVHDAAARPHH